MAFVDFAKQEAEAAFIKKLFNRLGIKATVHEAIGYLAATIRDHAHLTSLLVDTEPSMRQELYDSVRPNLKFRPKPLDVYMAEAAQRAEREQLPILDANGNLQPFKPASDGDTLMKEAEDLLLKELATRTLTLKCARCTAEETFVGLDGETRVAVILKARKKGWIYNPVRQDETCPACAQRANA